MSFLVQHIRSGEFGKRPQPLDLAPGQLAVNYNAASTGLFFRTDTGELVKAGPVFVGPNAPVLTNYETPSIGEMWLDTTNPTSPLLYIWTQAGWVTSSAVIEGATLTSNLFPDADNTLDLGSPTNRFANIYTNNLYTGDLHLKNERGDWSVIEEDEYLTIRSNKTGKRFKLVMEELD